MAEKPRARSSERDIWKRDSGHRKDKNGKPVMVHAGRQTIRTGTCEKHQEPSSTFMGINANGWIFKCSPRGDLPHYFVNAPAKPGGGVDE